MSTLFAPLPDKKYDIIYADPPWKYRSTMDSGSRPDNHYPTLTLGELKTLPIQAIRNEDSLLFLWTTGPCMAESIELANHWGFNYATVAFVWEKRHTTPGFYTMGSCEFVLVFKHGKIPQPRGARNIRQFMQFPIKGHSYKPALIRERIHEMFPEQDAIELFARETSHLMDSWGNDV